MPTNPDEPVSPVTRNEPVFGGVVVTSAGLTKREKFAESAMQSLVNPHDGVDWLAKTMDRAVILADALIVSLNKEKESLNDDPQ